MAMESQANHLTQVEDQEENIKQDDNTGLNLIDLPVEVFLNICEFLDAKFLLLTLRLVCKQFYEALSDAHIWKQRLNNLFGPSKHLLLEGSNPCLKYYALTESEYFHWTNRENSTKYYISTCAHYSAVDAILLLDSSLCVTGSRDRYLMIWKLDHPREGLSSFEPALRLPAHEGWIWNLARSQNILYSCSWDSTVKAWDIEMDFQKLDLYRYESAVLNVVCDENLVVASLYSANVVINDRRSGNDAVSKYRPHQRPILALEKLDNLIVSASEDETLAVYDLRAGQVIADRIKIHGREGLCVRNYPMSLSFKENILLVGDVHGQVHLIDTNSKFEIVETYNVGHDRGVNEIRFCYGSLLTGSTDGTIRISSPTRNPKTYDVIRSYSKEISSFDYKNEILAIGGTECSVEVFVPADS